MMPAELGDRAQDCWRPLLAIADALGGGWPAIARKAAVALSGVTPESNEDASHRVLLLTHIREIFDEIAKKGQTDIGSKHLMELLCAREDWPWGEWRQGKAISAHGVAKLLRSHGIRAKHERTGSVYAREMFVDAWQRYLTPPSPDPSILSVTSVTDLEKTRNNSELRPFARPKLSVTSAATVTDEKTQKLHVSQLVKPPVTDVTDETPASGTGGNGAALPMINDDDFELF